MFRAAGMNLVNWQDISSNRVWRVSLSPEIEIIPLERQPLKNILLAHGV